MHTPQPLQKGGLRMRMLRLVFPPCFLTAAVLLLLVLGRPAQQSHADAKKAAPAQPEGSVVMLSSAPRERLFPGLVCEHITAVYVSTPERSFVFECSAPDRISVNGHSADSEIFDTLLEQICQLPVDAHAAFSPEHAPALTLTVVSGESRHTARFYSDSGSEDTRILLAGAGEPVYRQTDAWRIGTLLMTCEGTRMEDENGRPVISE